MKRSTLPSVILARELCTFAAKTSQCHSRSLHRPARDATKHDDSSSATHHDIKHNENDSPANDRTTHIYNTQLTNAGRLWHPRFLRHQKYGCGCWTNAEQHYYFVVALDDDYNYHRLLLLLDDRNIITSSSSSHDPNNKHSHYYC